MALPTSQLDRDDSDVTDQKKTRSARWWFTVCLSLLLLLLIVGSLFASHYQPIVVAGGWGVGHPIGAHEETETQDVWLRNTGPIGVTVISLKSFEHDGLSSQVRLATAMICPIVTSRAGDCIQNRKTGLLEGKIFHPFSLTTDVNHPVLLRYTFPCVSSTDAPTATGTITSPVTYRFLWFTHRILLTESALDTASC
jgi:hypothetical protein